MTRSYLLGGQRVALRSGTGAVTYLHADQVGSVVLSTQGTAITAAHQYRAYGVKRGGNDYAFAPNYTGQRLDDTGLYYYGARYYDPLLGAFISPDSLIPDPTHYPAYNRYLYADANPLKYNDPSGHCVWDLCIGESVLLYAAAGAAVGAYAYYSYTYFWGPNATENRDALASNLSEWITPDPDQSGQTVWTDPPATRQASLPPTSLTQGESDGIHGIEPVADGGLQILADPLSAPSRPTIYTSSQELDANMQAAGIVRPSHTAAHHIVAENDPRAARSRAILAGAGIGINDAQNGVYLPGTQTSNNPTGAAIHSSLHTNRYYQEVEQRLRGPSSGSVQGELDLIRQELLNNSFP